MAMARKVVVFTAVLAVFAAALLAWRHGENPPARAPDGASKARSEVATAAAAPAPSEAAPPAVPDERTAASREPARPAVDEDMPQPTQLAPMKRTPEPATRSAVAAMLDAPIDRNHAIDLFAEHLAALDQGNSDDPTDKDNAQRLREFAARADGGDDSQQIARALQERLQDWLAQFSTERANHFALISVECKVGECQVLLAESSVDLTSEAGRNALDLAPALIALTQTRWWQQLGVAFVGSEMTAADADPQGVPRYALWTIYLSVAPAG
jgi:hypothetical protein